MSAAIVRLECFGQSLGPRRQQETTDAALKEAYLRGVMEGGANAHNAVLTSAVDELRALSSHLRDNEAKRHRDFSTLLELSLFPMLDALMVHVAPLGMKQRLSQFITAELMRIAKTAPSAEATIRCPADIVDELTAIATTAGVSNIRIEQVTQGDPRIEILIEEGSVVFQPAKFVNELLDLITTFQGSVPE